MSLKCRGKKYKIAIWETIGEVEFVIATEDEIEVEGFSSDCGKVADEACIGLMIDFTAELFIFLKHLSPHCPDIAHL